MKKILPGDPETQSSRVVGENVERLRELFPEAFAEDGIDFEVLKQILGGAVNEREEKYGLNWHGKRRARQAALTPSTGTLRPAPEESVDWDTTKNLFIEGDNLEVLKLLQKSYAGKVKLIYIDPPYNTGNDFVYPDDYKDGVRNYQMLTGQVDSDGRKMTSNTEADGRFHTNWLNMMYPRLRLAWNLLRSDGAVFASIDDHEVQNLRHVMDELFGRENFVGQVVVVSNPRGRQSEIIATTHEYILVYAKDSESVAISGAPLSSKAKSEYKHLTPDGRRYRLRGLRHRGNASLRKDRPKMFFPLYVDPRTKSVSMQSSAAHSEKVLPRKSTGEDGRWEWGPETTEQRLNLLEGVYIAGRQQWDVYQREFLEDGSGSVRTMKWKSLWNEKEINYQNGTVELKDLLGAGAFEYPKPTYLLKKLISGATVSGDIVLDFFAGSGTTGDALMQLNAAGDGNRRFLLIQLAEKRDTPDYATFAEITKARLRAAAESIAKESTDSLPGLEQSREVDLGFRVFKLDTSNIQEWEANRDDLAQSLENHQEHLKFDRTNDDILYEVLLKSGLDLAEPIETRTIAGKEVHCVGAGTLFVCLEKSIKAADVEELGTGIVAWKRELDPAGDTRVIFRDAAFGGSDVAKTNMAEILVQGGFTTVRSL